MSQHQNDRLPRPEEFPLGSIESRAAARALCESREKTITFGFSDDDPIWGMINREFPAPGQSSEN